MTTVYHAILGLAGRSDQALFCVSASAGSFI